MWRETKHNRAFTLVELLVALMVTSIVLGAVATLAYALGTANDALGDTGEKQAQVRYATLKISELIRHCKLICDVQNESLAIWRADDDDDGEIDIRELVYIETEPATQSLQLVEFSPPPIHEDRVVRLDEIQGHTIRPWLTGNCEVIYTVLVSQCSSVRFVAVPAPPWSKFVNVSFDLLENESTRQYQISASPRNWAGYLLNEAGDAFVSDDD